MLISRNHASEGPSKVKLNWVNRGSFFGLLSLAHEELQRMAGLNLQLHYFNHFVKLQRLRNTLLFHSASSLVPLTHSLPGLRLESQKSKSAYGTKLDSFLCCSPPTRALLAQRVRLDLNAQLRSQLAQLFCSRHDCRLGTRNWSGNVHPGARCAEFLAHAQRGRYKICWEKSGAMFPKNPKNPRYELTPAA